MCMHTQEVADKERELMLQELAMLMTAAGLGQATADTAKQWTLQQWTHDLFPVRYPHLPTHTIPNSTL